MWGEKRVDVNTCLDVTKYLTVRLPVTGRLDFLEAEVREYVLSIGWSSGKFWTSFSMQMPSSLLNSKMRSLGAVSLQGNKYESEEKWRQSEEPKGVC